MRPHASRQLPGGTLLLALAMLLSAGPACENSAVLAADNLDVQLTGTTATTATFFFGVSAEQTVGLAAASLNCSVDVLAGTETLTVTVTPAGGSPNAASGPAAASISGEPHDRYLVELGDVSSQCTEGESCALTFEVSVAATTAPAAPIDATLTIGGVITGDSVSSSGVSLDFL